MVEDKGEGLLGYDVDGPSTLRDSAATGTSTEAWQIKKEDSRRPLALILFGIFAVVVLAPLMAALAICLGAPDQQACFSALMPIVFDRLGQFIATAFAPLLAFILGFYFSGN